MYNPTVLMGVELEVEIQGDPNKASLHTSPYTIYGSYPKHHDMGKTHHKHGVIAKAVDDLCEGRITSNHDNTINDGFEWIGNAMSLKDNKELWGLLLSHPEIQPYIHGEDVKVTNHPYGIHDCGMHVHVSGDPVTPLVLGKVFMFMNKKENKVFIEYVAGRSLNKFCSIQPEKKIGSISALYHSINCRKRTKRATKIMYRLNGTWDCLLPSGLPCCPNGARLLNSQFTRGAMWVSPAQNAGEYEIRIFKSAVNPERFNVNLEFCVALIEFCHQAKLTELTVKEFKKWMSTFQVRLTYLNLFKFMRKEGYATGIIPKVDTIKAMIKTGRLPELKSVRAVQ